MIISFSSFLIFSQFLPINTPTLLVNIINSPSFVVFLIIILAIPVFGYFFSIKFLIFISSTKKSAHCCWFFANHSDGRDFMIHTLIPIGCTFCHIKLIT